VVADREIARPEAPEFRYLPYANRDFKKLTWVSIVNNAAVETFFFLDNFALTPK
jgi:hypothetical protein